MSKQRGIHEVPMDPTHPSSAEQTRQLLLDLRDSVIALRRSTVTPTPPSNFKATPMAFAVLLQWTRGVNADGTEVLWNTTANLNGAVVVDVGSSNQHVDYVGNATQKRFYWIRSYDAHAPVRSIEIGPVAATPLASGTAATAPTAPPTSQKMTVNSTTGRVEDHSNPHYRGY